MTETVDKPSEYGSESGTNRFYVVEARCTHPDHRVVNGVLLTREWKRLQTTEMQGSTLVRVGDAIAVPATGYPRQAADSGLLNRAAAFALAARFQVDEDRYSGGQSVLCVETRLVEVELTWSYSIKEIGVCEPLSLFELLRHLKSTPRVAEEPR